MAKKVSSYEGRQDQIRSWETPEIETFSNIYADRNYQIEMQIPEFTCICPKTGLPDFASFTLRYTPARLCLELKSFKEYLLAYRSQGIFHENVVNRMVDDLVAAIRPRELELTGIFNPRGGIQTTVRRVYRSKRT